LAVEPTASLPPLTVSQAQPEPKRVAPALAKSSLNLAKPPSSASMAAASLPWGAALAGAHDGPEERVIAVPAGVVAYAAADGLGHLRQVGDQRVDVECGEGAWSLRRLLALVM